MQDAEHNSADYTAPRMAQAPVAAVAASKTEGLSFAGCHGDLRPVRGGPTPSFSLKEVLYWLGVRGKDHWIMRRSARTKGGVEVGDDIHIDGTHVLRLIAARKSEAATEAICLLMSTPPKIRQLKRQRDELQDRVLCAICMEPDAPRSVLLSPCNHLVAFAACAPKLKDCPLCRGRVKKRIKIKNSS
jgi:hypothetical protein